MNQPPVDAPNTPSTPPSSTGAPSSEERTLALLSHLLGLFTWILGPLIIWLVKKDASPFVEDQAKEALNFQITMLIAYLIAGATTFIGIGCLLIPAVYVINLVFCIIATVAASRGERYRYPLALRLVS